MKWPALLLLAAACHVPRPVVPSEDGRIARIEENLLPAVMIEGRGGGRPITERMAEHGVKGLTLAVLDQGRVIWTRGYGDLTPESRLPAGDLGLPEGELTAAEAGAALAKAGAPARREMGTAALYYDPRKGQGAVAMTRSLKGSALAAELLRAIAAEYDWRGYPGPQVKKTVTLSREKLAEYAGRYRVSPQGTLELEVTEDGRLTMALGYGESAELYASGEDRFFLLDRDTIVTFERASGKVTALTAIVTGRTIRAVRE